MNPTQKESTVARILGYTVTMGDARKRFAAHAELSICPNGVGIAIQAYGFSLPLTGPLAKACRQGLRNTSLIGSPIH